MELDERLLLEEPGDEVPGLIIAGEDGPAVPAEAETAEAGAAKGSPVDKEAVETSIAGAINSEVAKAYLDIDSINGLVSSIRYDLPGRDDVIGILEAVADDRAVHVGMLQKAADLLEGTAGLIAIGGDKAGEIAGESSPEEGGEE